MVTRAARDLLAEGTGRHRRADDQTRESRLAQVCQQTVDSIRWRTAASAASQP